MFLVYLVIGALQMFFDDDDDDVRMTATGCPDYKPDSGGTWVRYSPDRQTAEVGCQESSITQTWQLVCRAGDWTGYVDNCSPLGNHFLINC